jgi:hypothetical protein
MCNAGYSFKPVLSLNKIGNKKLETEDHCKKRIGSVEVYIKRLELVSNAYDYLVEQKLFLDKTETKKYWQVIEDLLNNEGIRLRKVLNIRSEEKN